MSRMQLYFRRWKASSGLFTMQQHSMLPPTVGFRAGLAAPGRGDTGDCGPSWQWWGRYSDAAIPRLVPEGH